MYNKVSTNMNFVEREKEIEKFWRDNDIFKKVWRTGKREKPIPSMTDRRLQMENRISVMY